MSFLAKKNIKDIDVSGKKVLMRVDFNVPLSKGEIKADMRIAAAVPTINYLLDHGAAVILMSHLGRPAGKRDDALSLAPVADRLSKILNKPVKFVDDCIGPKACSAAADLKSGELLFLENLRFHCEEEKNTPEFAEKLSRLADIYVNDAFGVAHRAHASTEGISHFLPSVGGFLIDKEIQVLGSVIGEPHRPYIAIIGGAKVSDKILVIENLLQKVDKLLIGGGMANTFLAAAGYNMQASRVENDRLDWAREILGHQESMKKLLLPVDLKVAAQFSVDSDTEVCALDAIPDGWQALDIGPATVDSFVTAIDNAGTIFWNGPLGVFEMEAFAGGTMAMARAVANTPAFSIVGGGDSVFAVHKAGVADSISHISTGGGASLRFLEGELLPGLDALADKCT
jgi:phosphoglycerate kinase